MVFPTDMASFRCVTLVLHRFTQHNTTAALICCTCSYFKFMDGPFTIPLLLWTNIKFRRNHRRDIYNKPLWRSYRHCLYGIETRNERLPAFFFSPVDVGAFASPLLALTPPAIQTRLIPVCFTAFLIFLIKNIDDRVLNRCAQIRQMF